MKFRAWGPKSETGPFLLWNKYVFFMKWNNKKKMSEPSPGPTGAPGPPFAGAMEICKYAYKK